MKILDSQTSEAIFKSASSNIKEMLNSLNLEIDNKIIKKEWQINRLFFRESLLSDFDENFLKNYKISGLMFQSDMDLANKELMYIGTEILKKIKEYAFSNKNFNIGELSVSTNSIHHIYHLMRYLKFKEIDFENVDVKSVLEWGGGYGNMCKNITELMGGIDKYTIVDLPEFTVLQYIYLSSYFGQDNVRIIKNVNNIDAGINLMPVNEIVNSKIPKNDMFISNWAISESSMFCQNYANENGFFDCENILMSYHQCGYHIPFMAESSELDRLLKDRGIHIENVEIIPGINYYAFR